MPFSSGVYTLPSNSFAVPVTGTVISSSSAISTFADFTTAFSTCVLKDGTQTLTANIPMGSFKLTGLSAGTAAGHSLRFEQLFTSAGITLIGNLLFTDATFDIGASGATRPRDFYLSRNSVIGGTETVGTTIGVGAATPSASGAGITFPATQSASTDVNTLDDYEEGTWTPAIGGTATYTTQIGTYTKIGRVVHVSCSLTINSKGTGSANDITGLPFTIGQTVANSVGYWTSLAVTPVSMGIIGNSGGTTLSFVGLAAAGASVSNPLNPLGNGAGVIFTLTYFV